MSAARRRAKRPRTHGQGPAAPAQPVQQQGGSATPPVAAWNWRTFPVYFGFATGIFGGVYAGYLAGYINGTDGNETPGLVAFVGAALLLGFGLARVTTRFMVTHNWVKPRPKRR